MLQTIEFSTVLSDNKRIEIPVNVRSQLKAGQVIRVVVSFDSEDKIIIENS